MLKTQRFEFTGGTLCLDFTNTVDNRGSEHRKELLIAYPDLVHWATEAGAISASDAADLQNLAKETPGQAQSVLREAIQLREAIYAIFSSLAERRVVPAAALAALNAAAQHASEHARITLANRRFRWEWISPEASLDSVLWPVARSAADLLTSDQLAFVRLCASQTCAWLFLDKTKNHRRRWCEMRTCGNRDKARRYYERTRKR
jgi:predicted RNA-binding Zn ribbon-like protein